jgi:hypothetical protein
MSDQALPKSIDPVEQLDLIIGEALILADDLRFHLVSAHLAVARDALNHARPKRTI